MSKMFDYISGKKVGKVAKLEAELESLMTHCVPIPDYREMRDAIIEECAKVAETNGFSLTIARGAVGSTIAAASTIAGAIRALKDKPIP